MCSAAVVHGVPYFIIGNGSNVLISDAGVRTLTIVMTCLCKASHLSTWVAAQNGAEIMGVSKYALEQQLSGLKFVCGIPETVSGAVYMNAGAKKPTRSDYECVC